MQTVSLGLELPVLSFQFPQLGDQGGKPLVPDCLQLLSSCVGHLLNRVIVGRGRTVQAGVPLATLLRSGVPSVVRQDG